MSFHRITVIGHAGSNPDHQVTATGKDYTFFPLYVNERREESERTTRYRVKTWGDLALMVKDHLQKGQLLLVDGTPSVEAWRDGNGKPRAQLVVTARTLRFLGSRPAGRNDAEAADALDEYTDVIRR